MAKGKQQDAAPVAEELKDQEPAPVQEPDTATEQTPVPDSQEAETQGGEPAETAESQGGEPEEPPVVTEEESEESADDAELVTVRNAAKSSLRQPSSGWEIEPGKSRKLLNDGWLENQLNAQLLVRV